MVHHSRSQTSEDDDPTADQEDVVPPLPIRIKLGLMVGELQKLAGVMPSGREAVMQYQENGDQCCRNSCALLVSREPVLGEALSGH